MNKIVYIGIDISKATLDLCIREDERDCFLEINNNPKEIKKAFKAYNTKEVILCMENTGRYNQQLYEVLKTLSFKVYVVHAQHIKQSIGFVRGKNDKIDASRICKFIIKNHQELQAWIPNSPVVDSLKVLVSERRSLVKERKKVKTQIKELAVFKTKDLKPLIKLKRNHITFLDKLIEKVERMIREKIKEDKCLKENFNRLKTIPGVGEVTIWLLIVKTNAFTRLMDGRKLGCFAGVVPFDHQSGTSIRSKPRVSKKADMELKTVLHMAAMRATRLINNDFEKYYKRKLQEGKNPMTVLNAIRNKILHVAVAIIKNKSFYQNRLPMS